MGLSVIAIDLHSRENSEYPIVYQDAATYEYKPGSTVIMARPCHGHSFVLPTIEQAMRCAVAKIVYIGLPKNVDSDLGPYRRHFKSVLRNCGRSKESIYIIERELCTKQI